MKFMKLGSMPDVLQSDGENVRFVSSEVATDIMVKVGNVKFRLHKFPLLSKSARLQKLVMSMSDDRRDKIDISDIPGGHASFEICAKFCYGMTVTLNPYNIVAARCAAEHLEMYESVEKGNLVYKIEVFLASSIFRSWKDSIIVLQTTRALLPYSEELKLASQCIELISTKACVDPSRVDWSYAYNCRKFGAEVEEHELNVGIRTRPVPKDWWVEDLCELDIELYKRVLAHIKMKCLLPNEIIGESLKAYAYRKLPEFSKGTDDTGEILKYRATVETIILLLPEEKCCVSCGFMLKLLKSAMSVDLGEAVKRNLMKKIGRQLEEASVTNLLIRASEESTMMYDVDTVVHILREFLSFESCNNEIEPSGDAQQLRDAMLKPGILSEASKLMVVKLIDTYLGEIAKDPNLPLSKFVELAEMMSSVPRPCHDGLYRAIDTYLKEHPGIGKSERRRICKLMDCRKLTPDSCLHAVQNERLPLRVVVQVLFFEQVRAALSGSSTLDLAKGIRDLNNLSQGSSRSATTVNNDEDWDALAAAQELKALKSELAYLHLSNTSRTEKNSMDRTALNRVKGILRSRKMFTKMLSWKGGGENSGSDSSGSLGSGNAAEDGKRTPCRNRRYSVS